MAETSRAWSWCKVSVRVLTDPKILKAARRSGPSVHGVLLWALSTNAGGGYEGEIPLTEWDAETVATLIGCDGDDIDDDGSETVQRSFDALVKTGFFVLDGDSIMIPGWSKWRPESPSTDRVRAWRERKEQEKRDETLRNVSGVTTVSVTQEERRVEEKREKDARARDDVHVQDGANAKATATRKSAESLADTFRPFLLAVDPSNPIRDKGAWSLKRAEGVGPLVRLLADYDREHIGAVMAWAMRDDTPGKGNWRGWKFKIGSLTDFERHFTEIRKAWLEATTAPPPTTAPSPPQPPVDPKEGDWWHPEWRPIPAGFYVASGHLRRARERPQPTATPTGATA